MRETLLCPICKCPTLHLVDIRQVDDNHPNKIELHFSCDAGCENSCFDVWGHEGGKERMLYAITEVNQ